MKILLVDDNQDITTMFSKYFRLKGHEVSVANDGHNGLQMIENENHDVVLLDLAMPGFSGRDIVDKLHKSGRMAEKRIISLTASSISDEDKEYLMDRGIHSVLKKPIDPDELLNYLSNMRR